MFRKILHSVFGKYVPKIDICFLLIANISVYLIIWRKIIAVIYMHLLLFHVVHADF